MKIAVRLSLLTVGVVIGAWLWTIFFPSPEKIVRRRLAQVAEDVSFNANESPLAALGKTQKLAGLFNTNVDVEVDLPERSQHSVATRDEIMQAAAGAHTEASDLSVKFLDLNVTLAADKQSATADLTVEARAAGKDSFTQEMKFTFEKIGGDWLITRIETVRTLS